MQALGTNFRFATICPVLQALYLKQNEQHMSDELIEELELANSGDLPSPFGKAEFEVLGSPASVQSKKAVRDVYINAIREKKGVKH